MFEIFNELDARFSETQLSEFAHETNESVLAFLQNHENDFTEKDIALLKQVIQRDCEMFGW
jgi:hypothetical protein